MNLTNFLQQTDALMAQYSAEQLMAFIHEIGRVFPEHRREDFLERLRAVGGKTQKASVGNTETDSEFTEMYNRIRDNLKKIDSQEVMLTGVLNEEYDDWYDDGEEFYYEDNNGISDMLAEACDFIHICMDRAMYKEGFEVGNQVFSMEILCENEYGEEEFSIGDMVEHELLYCDLKRVILDTLYCAYYAVPQSKRPAALYGIFANARESEITLEAVMQHGDEVLPDLESFLPLWITYLGEKAGQEADRLLVEAVGLLNDISQAVRYAKEYVTVHPGLYLHILENGKYMADGNDMVAVGIGAIEVIPKKYRMRSKAALKTAEYVLETGGKKPLLEICYFAAYESDTSALNYLRAVLNGFESEKKREELRKVFMKFSDHTGRTNSAMYGFENVHSYSEREENKPDRNMILLLRFLDGQFADVLDRGLSISNALGWTGTFMKQGIALYLLYLYEGAWNGKGITAMAGMVKDAIRFSAEEYLEGTVRLDNIDELDLFRQIFLRWKSQVQMEPAVRERALKRITALIEKRTAGIMDANRRNYYWECASYIAALGEVREVLGETGAKQRMMTAYKDKYPRRSAFREELRNYGWIDHKKR